MANPTNFNIYTWLDAGAPILTTVGPQAGSAAQITNILDLCLVTGYGSKTPAGWTKPYQSGLYHVYQMGANSSGRYFQIHATPPEVGKSTQLLYCMRTDVFDSMTSATAGTNSIYGTDYVNSIGWSVVDTTATTKSTKIPWVIIANSATVYFMRPRYYAQMTHLGTLGVADIICNDGVKRTILMNEPQPLGFPHEVDHGQDSSVTYPVGMSGGGCFLTNHNRGSKMVYASGANNTNPRGMASVNRVALESPGFFSSTYSGGSNQPVYGDTSNKDMKLEKIYVVSTTRNRGIVMYGRLPGVYRTRVPYYMYKRFFEKGDYMFVTYPPFSYSETRGGLVIDKTGAWYG